MGDRPKVLCVVDLSMVPEALDILRASVYLDYRPSERETVGDIIGEYDALWSHVDLKLDNEILRRAVNLRVINTASTGTDHIDKDEARKRGIRILSITRDYGLLRNFTATAECAWMLLLACMRHFRTAVGYALAGKWNKEPSAREELRGRQLFERTLGVLGVGRLGTMTAGFGKGFQMKVLGCDLKSFSLPGVEQVDFDTLMAQSDAISIHIHMTPENYHLFNAETFGNMKEGAVLINTSRGDIVDEQALLEALESRRLSAYGADVVHDEWRSDLRENPLIRYARHHNNLVLTPHIGGDTYRSVIDARIFSARKLVHFLNTGEELTIS